MRTSRPDGSGPRAAAAPRGVASCAALLAVLLVLASCGTVPPGPSSPGSSLTEPARTTTTTTPEPTPTPTPTKEAASPSAATGPAKSSARSKPTKITPTSPSDPWVGTFKGHEIRVPRGHGARMSFTFDDGPWPGSTSQVLALLEQHHVKAVFCVVGNQARAHPALVRQEVAAGHELCNHSRDHDVYMGRKSQAYVNAEVGDGLAQIKRAAPPGTPVTFYRQPGGAWNPKVVRAMDAHGLDPLRWSNDPRDWSRPGSLVIVRRVVANLRPGAVVLMHDGGGDRSQSVEALRFLLDAVVQAGWKPVLAPHVKLSPKAAAKPG